MSRQQSGMFLLVTTLILSAATAAFTAPPSPQTATQPAQRLDWWGDTDGFLNRQTQETLNLVSQVLALYPPRLRESLPRCSALMMIDLVLHDPAAPKRPPVQAFFHSRMESAAKAIESTRVSEGAVIWKLYDHGFVVRTPSVTFGFDLIRGYSARAKGFPVADEVLGRIARQCDALFISHLHPDHADPWVARAFLDQGKPVLAPPEVWKSQPIHRKITHPARQADKIQTVAIQHGKRELKVIVYPGHQGATIQNNVWLVTTPEGMTFSQTGDQSNTDDFSWIDTVGAHHRVDVLMPNCWTTDMTRLVEGFNPALVITGHENELGHTIDHREPFWLSRIRLQDVTCPWLLMTWGESYHYRPVRH